VRTQKSKLFINTLVHVLKIQILHTSYDVAFKSYAMNFFDKVFIVIIIAYN